MANPRTTTRGARSHQAGRRTPVSRSSSRSPGRSTRTRSSAATRGSRRQTGGVFNGPQNQSTPELEAFFGRFTTCLTSGDGDGAAACFDYPALMVMATSGQGGGNQLLQDERTVSEFFGKAPQMYHEKGVHDTFADIVRVEPLSADLCLVQARFPYIDADGNDLGDGEESIYILRETPDGYRITSAVTLGVDSERTDRRDRGGSRRGNKVRVTNDPGNQADFV